MLFRPPRVIMARLWLRCANWPSPGVGLRPQLRIANEDRSHQSHMALRSTSWVMIASRPGDTRGRSQP